MYEIMKCPNIVRCMPCCECLKILTEEATKDFFVCIGCRINGDGIDLDGLWSEYLSFLFPFPCKPRALVREKHYSAWQMGLLGSRETAEFLAFSFRNS